jgi:hypothetical protein
MPENPTREGANNLVYGILIDVDSNPTTGKFGVDFQKEIQWSNTTQQWNNFRQTKCACDSSCGQFSIL